MATPAVKKDSNFDHLATRTSTQVARGWKRIVHDVRVERRVAISSHDTIEAIVLSPEEYRAMQDAIEQARGNKTNVIDELTRRFDQNLSSLKSPDASEKVKSLLPRQVVAKERRVLRLANRSNDRPSICPGPCWCQWCRQKFGAGFNVI